MDDFERQFPSLFRRADGVAFVIVGDREDARDIAQEALARLHVHWGKVSEFSSPWVVRVAGNLALDCVRRRSRIRYLQALRRRSTRGRCGARSRLLGGNVKTHASRGLGALRIALGGSR